VSHGNPLQILQTILNAAKKNTSSLTSRIESGAMVVDQIVIIGRADDYVPSRVISEVINSASIQSL
jgi:hypothetical protein